MQGNRAFRRAQKSKRQNPHGRTYKAKADHQPGEPDRLVERVELIGAAISSVGTEVLGKMDRRTKRNHLQ